MTKLIHRSGGSNEWKTPDRVRLPLKESFQIRLDACASDDHMCSTFHNEEADGLVMPWIGNPSQGYNFGYFWNYFNCPYSGKGVQERWIEKALAERDKRNACSLGLIPARMGNGANQLALDEAKYALFIKGRLTFGTEDQWIAHWIDKWDKEEIGHRYLLEAVPYDIVLRHTNNLNIIEQLHELRELYPNKMAKRVRMDNAGFNSVIYVFMPRRFYLGAVEIKALQDGIGGKLIKL